MKDSKIGKFLFGFATVAITSGIYLIFREDYFFGILGAFSGLFLIYLQNMATVKDDSIEQ